MNGILGIISDWLSSIKRTLLIICFSVLSLISPVLIAQGEIAERFDIQNLDIEWLPGERYDPVRGVMDYTHEDIYLPGNGQLPIVLTRRFLQRRNGADFEPKGGFGHMHYEVPVLSFRFEDGNVEHPCLFNGNVGNTTSLRAPITFIYGKDIRQVFYREAGHEPEHGDFISAEGWSMRCSPNPANAPEGGFSIFGALAGNLTVRSPNGIEYEMHSRKVPSQLGASYKLYKISDPYGNSLVYDIADTREVKNGNAIYGTKLTAITASDGRKVSINYGSDGKKIDSIETNSSSNPVKIKYEYPSDNQLRVTRNDIETTTFDFDNGKISKITYPTGGSVSYGYGEFVSTTGTLFKTLASRIQSDSGQYQFALSESGDLITSIIKTPTAWTEHTIGKPKYEAGYTTNSGRQLRLKRYDVSWSGSTVTRGQLLLDTTTTYKNLRWASSEDRNADTSLVVPETITTTMYPTTGGGSGSVFKTTYVGHDHWGFPQQVRETSPGGANIYTNYTYKHGGFSRWILGKAENVVQTGGGDTIRYSYNAQGDVASETVNGVTTNYAWYESGSSSAGELASKTINGKNTTYYNYKRGIAQRECSHVFRCKDVEVDDDGSIVSESRFASIYYSTTTSRTRYQYDALRRLKSIDPARIQAATENHQWISNNQRRITDASNTRYQRSLILDSFGRKIAEGTQDKDQNRWNTRMYEYDRTGRLVFESIPVNVSPLTRYLNYPLTGTRFEYDALNRLKSIRINAYPSENVITNYYYGTDSSGNPTIAQSDGSGSTTTTTFQAYGAPDYSQPVRIVQPDGTTTSISVNPHSGRIHLYSRAGLTTRYEYNDRRQLSAFIQPENGRTDFTYYDDGLLRTRNNQGRSKLYEYYPDNRLRKETFTDSSREDIKREYKYDAYGNLEFLITSSQYGNQNNTVKFIYDDDNNVVQQDLLIDGYVFIVRYEYDELSNVSYVTYPNGRRYSLSPNSFGDPKAIKEQGGKGKIIYDWVEYNANNSMNVMRRNGHQIKNDIDDAQRPLKYRLEQSGLGQYGSLGEKQYFYDAVSNVSRINDTVNNQYVTYQYDNRDRLTHVYGSREGNWSFNYLQNDDIASMRVNGEMATFNYDSSSRRLRGISTQGIERRFEYDLHGNMTVHERINGPSSKAGQLLAYNAANQLTDSSDGSRYAYDARGLRVRVKQKNTVYTMYGPDEKLIYRYDPVADVKSEYFYVDGKLVARRDTGE